MKAILFPILLFLFVFPAQATERQSAFDRVIKSGTIRCGYWNWAPLYSVNSVTGVHGGIFRDLMDNVIGPSLGLKIEWALEVGFANPEQDLMTGKIDAFCAGIWPMAPRGRVMEFSDPVFYVPLQVYVRPDDKRFDNNLKALNAENITFAGMDGLVERAIVAQDFPKSKRISLPDTAGMSELFIMVKGGKADAVIADLFTAASFLKNNQGALRAVKANNPVRYFGTSIAANKGEHELVNMLNTALTEAQSSGAVEDILRKYEDVPGSLLRVAKPYELANETKHAP